MDETAWIIERNDMGLPMWFSCSLGRDYASPNGGWSPDFEQALRFSREKDAKQFLKNFMVHEEPFCRVIQKNGAQQ